MKTLKLLILRSGGLLASLALFVALKSMSTACFIWYHQPKVPDGLKKARE